MLVREILRSDGKIRNKNMTRITARSLKTSAGKENRFGGWGAWEACILPKDTSSQTSRVERCLSSSQKAANVLFNCREETPKPTSHTQTLSHAPGGLHLTLRLSGKVSANEEKAPSLLRHQLPTRNSYISACRVLIHYSMFLIHYKLHLNFLAHVHLWDILILSSFFMYRASKKRISKCNILLRNKLTAQFRVNFTAQWSERDLAANHTHLEGGLRRGLVLMGPVPCLQAK